MSAEAAVANFLLWFGKDLYASPEAAAKGLLRRLNHEGYEIVRKDTLPKDAA